jgi:hypothetical protein
MKAFPSERERQASDTRTVSWFFRVIFIVLIAYGLVLAGRYLLGWW